MSDQAASALFYTLMLILPLSALLARRIPIGQMAKMALAWAAVFLVGLIVVGQRDRIAPWWDSARDGLFGSDQRVAGDTVRIAMAPDGHFWAKVTLDGIERRMLIDSGATTTAISSATARAAGLDLGESQFPVMIGTANGDVLAQHTRVRRLEIGGIVARDLPVVVADAFGDTDVLGMNFLSRLASWRVEGRMLILQPKRP